MLLYVVFASLYRKLREQFFKLAHDRFFQYFSNSSHRSYPILLCYHTIISTIVLVPLIPFILDYGLRIAQSNFIVTKNTEQKMQNEGFRKRYKISIFREYVDGRRQGDYCWQSYLPAELVLPATSSRSPLSPRFIIILRSTVKIFLFLRLGSFLLRPYLFISFILPFFFSISHVLPSSCFT
jgi:hypothetical protein